MKAHIERGLKRFSWLFCFITGGVGFIIQGYVINFRFQSHHISYYIFSTLLGAILGFTIFRLIIWTIKGFSKDNTGETE